MRHNPALQCAWKIQPFSWKTTYGLGIVLIGVMCVELPLHWIFQGLIGVSCILYWGCQLRGMPYVTQLGYRPAGGWWICQNFSQEPITIRIMPGSRLLNRGLFLVYEENASAKHWLWLSKRAFIAEDFRTLCRLFRVLS